MTQPLCWHLAQDLTTHKQNFAYFRAKHIFLVAIALAISPCSSPLAWMFMVGSCSEKVFWAILFSVRPGGRGLLGPCERVLNHLWIQPSPPASLLRCPPDCCSCSDTAESWCHHQSLISDSSSYFCVFFATFPSF